MFRRKQKSQVETENPTQAGAKPSRWIKVSIYANIAVLAILVVAAAGGYLYYQSNTNPKMCDTCHLMDSHVQSYLTSTNLDHVHDQAGVQCKDCHDYPVSAEISSGIKFITGNYTTDSAGNLPRRKFDDAMCLKCHISYQHVAQLTDFLTRNPHDSHNGEMPCNTCHISHGQQIDFCSQCHDNGGQRMIGAPIEPRGTISGS
jgi:hypothetical protein